MTQVGTGQYADRLGHARDITAHVSDYRRPNHRVMWAAPVCVSL